jgi:hypothetical protein
MRLVPSQIDRDLDLDCDRDRDLDFDGDRTSTSTANVFRQADRMASDDWASETIFRRMT